MLLRFLLLLLVNSVSADNLRRMSGSKDFELYEQFKSLTDGLRNKHIVMIGDSLMRYQYVSLVHFLHYHEFNVDHHENMDINPTLSYAYNSTESSQSGNICHYAKWEDWNSYYKMLNHIYSPYEICDCCRGHEYNNDIADCDCPTENRYYINREKGFYITYIQSMNLIGEESDGPRGRWNPSVNSNVPKIGSKHTKAWTYNIASLLSTYLPQYSKSMSIPHPEVVMINAGFWPNKYHNITYAEDVFRIALDNYPRVVWKTTSYTSNHDNVGNLDREVKLWEKRFTRLEIMDLSWTKQVPQQDYLGSYHFVTCHVYNMINIQFLRLLQNNK